MGCLVLTPVDPFSYMLISFEETERIVLADSLLTPLPEVMLAFIKQVTL